MQRSGWRLVGLGGAILVMAGSTPALAGKPRPARELYNTKCALCHGRDGRANPAIAHAKPRHFDDAEWQRATTDSQIRQAIEEGRPDTLMRSFKNELEPEEIAGLVAVIRSLAPPEKK